MAKKKENEMTKTNAMRLLEQAGIPFRIETYEYDEEHLGGAHVAAQVSLPEEQVFKTLVVRGDKKGIMVFCIPVMMELDLKKAAKVSGNKNCDLIPMKELLPTTGYIRGGCSPIGMKKPFPTYIHSTAADFEYIYISAGVRGLQIQIAPNDLITVSNATLSDLINA